MLHLQDQVWDGKIPAVAIFNVILEAFFHFLLAKFARNIISNRTELDWTVDLELKLDLQA